MDKLKLDTLPFIDYVQNGNNDKYDNANEVINNTTGKSYIDKYNDFSIGASGGFLMNLHFTFTDIQLLMPAAIAYEKNSNDIGIRNWVKSLTIDERVENRKKYYYCPYLSGTPEYNGFWREETKRRRNGFTAKCKKLRTGEVVDLHITGDHYNYLNYGRILRTPNEEEQLELDAKGDSKTKQIEAFPRFWDGDYWNFKIDLFIANNNFHLAKGKARGKGYSYKRGNQAANTINLISNSTVILAAYDLKYLTDPQATSDMVKTNLDWYEGSTHWKRFYLSEVLDKIELGFKTKSGGNKKQGWRSRLLSVSLFNNESAAIGKRAIEIDFEESGKLPNLEQALDVTLSSTEVGAGNVGTIRVYGTAGTKGSNWEPFANVFFNPYKYKMMPFENVWDVNARARVCGFFHPQVLNMEPYMDENGNSLLNVAYIKDKEDKLRASKEMDTSKYIVYVGQRANSPEEAFKRGGENVFSSVELSNHVSNVLSNRELQSYRDGALIINKDNVLEFKTNVWLMANNHKSSAHKYIEEVPFNIKEDFYGCIREYYPPYKIDNEVPNDLYYVAYDPIAKDKKADTVIRKNSLVSIKVFMFPNNYNGIGSDMIVAAYAGRPERKEDADKIFLNLCNYYNCKGLPEVDTGDTVSNFRKWGVLHKLYTDPTVILNDKQKQNTTPSYGINTGSGSNALDGIDYLRDWLYTKRGVDENGNPKYTFHYIYDLPTLKELISFTLDGNFDRVSTMRVAMFVLKAMQVKKRNDIISSSKHRNSIFTDIGLYGYGN